MNTLFYDIEHGYTLKSIGQNPDSVSECSTILEEVSIAPAASGGWQFRLSNGGDLPCAEIDAAYRNIALYLGNETELCNATRFLLRTAFECRFCHEGIVSLHAACVELDGFAVAFTGHSGLGKSTRAKAWVDGLGAQWISGDRPAVRLERDGSTACGVPWDGKEQIFRDVEAPLRCILEVRRSPANYVRALSEEQARRVITQQCFIPMWDTDSAVLALSNARSLIRKTPVYRVFCGPDAQDARAIYDILVNHPEQIRKEEKEMKIRDGFVLRNVVDEFIVMPTGENIAKFEGAVVLNEVSAFVFRQLENAVSRDDLLTAIVNEFDVDEATAAADLDELLAQFGKMGLLED